MSKFWDKFWTVVEKMFEPLGRLFDKLDPYLPYFLPFFALVGDFITIYSVYFMIVTPEIPWLWIFPTLMICVPVMFFFNRAAISFIKDWWKKRKEKKQNLPN